MKIHLWILQTAYDDAQIKTDIYVRFEFWLEGALASLHL